jgi:hypothetical protein
MKKRAIVVGVLTTSVYLGATLDAGQPLRMQVSPAVARAPADLVVRVSVDADAGDRFLRVIAESADFYRSSEISIDGERTPPMNVFEFRNLPPGMYHVTGVLVGVNGRRAAVSKLATVEPPFGR